MQFVHDVVCLSGIFVRTTLFLTVLFLVSLKFYRAQGASSKTVPSVGPATALTPFVVGAGLYSFGGGKCVVCTLVSAYDFATCVCSVARSWTFF